MDKYFSFDEHDGFELHSTMEEAIEYAQAALDAERDEAIEDGEWYDEVETICCGVVTWKSKAKILSPDIVDYELIEIAE